MTCTRDHVVLYLDERETSSYVRERTDTSQCAGARNQKATFQSANVNKSRLACFPATTDRDIDMGVFGKLLYIVMRVY